MGRTATTSGGARAVKSAGKSSKSSNVIIGAVDGDVSPAPIPIETVLTPKSMKRNEVKGLPLVKLTPESRSLLRRVIGANRAGEKRVMSGLKHQAGEKVHRQKDGSVGLKKETTARIVRRIARCDA